MESKYIYKYLGAIAVIGLASYYGNRIKQGLANKDENDELIRQYLLNESPLYGFNRPKMWIHSKYETNARQWKDFMSRNSTDLNQPYLHFTIKTIIDNCGDDFNVCLIDDESFSRLIPDWDVSVGSMAEPFRSAFREVAMLKLLYIYGGVIMPNSFVCLKSILPLYKQCGDGPRFGETLFNSHFVPDTQFVIAQKGCPKLKSLILTLQERNKSNHFSDESKFLGATKQLLYQNSEIEAIDGKLLGMKTPCGKPILLEDMMSEEFLRLDKDAYGILIPGDEVLRRPKYAWLAYISKRELMKSNIVIVKHIKAAFQDCYKPESSVVKSVTPL